MTSLPSAPFRPTPRSRSASISATSINGISTIVNGNAPPLPPVPISNATHSSFVPTRYVKHATLINNCYPARPEEKGPKSSELSYLIFYTTSKPAKLTKVGSFIERRVARDHRKRRLSDVHCSLEIIKALILANKAHLNIFSKNVVVILDTLLVDVSDFDIVRHCQVVFACFCAAHDGSTLGVDPEFKTLYDHVVAKFADIAMLQGDGMNRFRSVGLKALEGVVSSGALYAYDHRAQLDLVLPSILDCLIDVKDGLHVSLDETAHSSVDSSRKSVSGTIDPEKEVGDDDVIADALQCLRALLRTSNGVNVKQALVPTFSYLDENGVWWPSSFSVGIIKAILNPIAPQFRYIMINEIITRIDSVDTTTPDMALRLQKKVTLISALEAILFSPLTLVGMPVLEILNALLAALIKSHASATSFSKEGESSQLLVLETLIQDGGLAAHIYYSNQVPHIISHIVGKLSYKIGVIPQPATIEGVPTVDYRKALLRCLTAAIKSSKEHGRQESNVHASEISSELLTPCLGLLLDSHVGVRTAFAQSLITFLVQEDDGHGHGGSLGSTLSGVSSDLYFRAAAHQTLHAYARLSIATPTDMAAVYGILRALYTHFQDDEFMRVVPVLFSLQDWCLSQEPATDDPYGGGNNQSPTTLVAQKRALATVIVIYLQKAVSNYDMAQPKEYLDNIKDSRESESQWYPIYYDNQECLTRTTTHQWETPSEPLSPALTHPLAREHLITLLTTVSDRFRAGADRFGLTFTPESLSSLMTAQMDTNSNSSNNINGHGNVHGNSNNNPSEAAGNGQFLSPFGHNANRGFMGHKSQRSVDSRIRVSRHLEEWALPKIVSEPAAQAGHDSSASAKESSQTSLDSTQISRSSFQGDLANGHKTIGVDNLKAALSGIQFQDMNGGGDTNSSIAGSDSRGPSPVGQRFYQLASPGYGSTPRLKQLQQQQHYGTVGGKSGFGGSSASIASNLAVSRPDLADLLDGIQVSIPSGEKHQSLVVPPY
ncbi:plasma membrane localization protein [Mortierella sp. NVP85]|nr:plasma membrane localization protein [Mortierella sp. NVP85]